MQAECSLRLFFIGLWDWLSVNSQVSVSDAISESLSDDQSKHSYPVRGFLVAVGIVFGIALLLPPLMRSATESGALEYIGSHNLSLFAQAAFLIVVLGALLGIGLSCYSRAVLFYKDMCRRGREVLEKKEKDHSLE